MWTKRYFPAHYFAPRYWPFLGSGTIVATFGNTPCVTLTSRQWTGTLTSRQWVGSVTSRQWTGTLTNRKCE